MKKYISLISALCLSAALQAQETSPTSALKYAQGDLSGTSRFRALSGAFGAVGGDLSAIGINPAGSGFFNYNTASFSLNISNKKNEASYFGTQTSDKYNGLNLGQMGTAFVFNNNNPESIWRKFVIGVNYENAQDFSNNLKAEGSNPGSSIGNYFLNMANRGNNGNPFPADRLKLYPNGSYTDPYQDLAASPNGFAAQQAFLGYQAYLFDATQEGNGFSSNIEPGSFYQANFISSSGYNGKLTGNFATQLGERLYVGANLNLHFTDYTQNSSVYEERENYKGEKVKSLQFDNNLYTYGNGFSFNIGAIAKVTEQLRVGAAYESPTWYRLNDELSQRVFSRHLDDAGQLTETNVNPNVINVFNEYKVQTPASYTASIAYIFGQTALLSVDYSRKDYGNTKYKPEAAFAYENEYISNNLKSTSELRIGAEYRIKQVSLRGGYRFEESPYTSAKVIGDLNSFSAGIGFDFGGSRLDLAYAHLSRPYDLNFTSSGMNDVARVKTKDNNINLTYTINF